MAFLALVESPVTASGATAILQRDRKSTRLNSSHTVIYTLSLHDALPISLTFTQAGGNAGSCNGFSGIGGVSCNCIWCYGDTSTRSEEHTSELQSHRDLHSFPTRRSSDLTDVYPSWRQRGELQWLFWHWWSLL